ncbi:MAG: hypothetical protein CVV47_07985 [Spirochaetae bacterium HGW-Spirochaetae-3]|jgi:hypothetical protein|nr:MAG: hypothetical protein CVV47_07985 [Spirochaetae bacterium HGW-Spirochaetae-3]
MPRRLPAALGRAASFAVRALACAAFACAVFFAVLSLWGALAAPFVRMRSSSFVVACALAVSAVATPASYGALRRWRRAGRARRDPGRVESS